MNDREIFNSKLAKRFARGSMWVIGLSVALSYVFATLVLLKDNIEGAIGDMIFILICILAIVPLIALGVFLWLAKKHCADICFKHGEHLLKMRRLEMTGEACLVVAKAIKFDSVKDEKELKAQLKEMLDLFSKICLDVESKSTGK